MEHYTISGIFNKEGSRNNIYTVAESDSVLVRASKQFGSVVDENNLVELITSETKRNIKHSAIANYLSINDFLTVSYDVGNVASGIFTDGLDENNLENIPVLTTKKSPGICVGRLNKKSPVHDRIADLERWVGSLPYIRLIGDFQVLYDEEKDTLRMFDFDDWIVDESIFSLKQDSYKLS